MMQKLVLLCLALLAIVVLPQSAWAEDGTDPGHNAWMLTSSALVLFMTVPGLAMFYSGLVRRKNVLGVIMQCLFLMGLMTVIWALYGYSLSFGGDGLYCGNGEFLFMRNVARVWNEPFEDANGNDKFDEGETYTDLNLNEQYDEGEVTPMFSEDLPMLTHMLFQGMFFIITPALICGAFAERMKFSTMVVFSILWGTIVYCPLCHCVWDGGALAFKTTKQMEAGEHWSAAMGGALDFAGGTVVHISSGVSALICALVLGRRLGMGTEDMRPHNLTYTAIGAGMLWVGWFGFNA
ncbi:MAG: ammonium transporter, partial [Planctomycetales bacterium]|nr:ammonium transporter [Planctomycetales bacterium]